MFEDTFFYQGSTHLPIEQHAAVAATRSGRQARAVVEHADAALRASRARQGAGHAGGAHPRHRDAQRRRLRRQERSVQPRGRVAKAALLLDRPVKICLTREEVFYCHRGRHPVLMHFKTGVKRDGTITGVQLETLLDGGAYGSYGVASTFYTGALQTVTYHVPAYHFQGCRVFTNKPPCGPKRGHGTPQSRFGQEVQLDKIAEALAIDPADLRLRIVEQPDTLTANYLRVGTIGLAECIRRVVARVGLAAPSSPAAARAAASASRARPTSPAPACRSTGTTCRIPACSSSSIAAAASRRSAARPKSARAPTMCWWRAWRRCWASIRSTSARSPAIPISRRSISARTRAA